MGRKKTPKKKVQKKEVLKKKKEEGYIESTDDADEDDIELDMDDEVEEVGLENIKSEDDDF